MARKGVFNSFPSASSVGIGLKEYGNLGSSHPDKVVDQSLRFVLIRGTQVKDKIGVGRLPLRLGSGKREKEIHVSLLVVLQQRQHSGNRVCADIIHQQKDIVVIDELDGVPNGGRGIVSVIVGGLVTAGKLTERLLDRGVNVLPIIYPAVPLKASRFRYFITSEHTPTQIRSAVQIMREELSSVERRKVA